jgi:hypothetical protein
MVTTVIALLVGLALVVVSVDQQRFERVLVGAARLEIRRTKNLPTHAGSEPPLLRVSRLLAFVLGGICIALGTAGVWALLH